MITMYRTDDEKVHSPETLEPGTWVHLVSPNANEQQWVIDNLEVDPDFLRAALDEEERARIDSENGQTLILVDSPLMVSDSAGEEYSTLPLGIIMTPNYIVTVCLKDSPIMNDFSSGRVKAFSTKKKSRFILQILYRNAMHFLFHLRQLDKKSSSLETELHKSMKNKELISMLKLEKSLVYFSTSLKGNEVVLERLLRMEFVRRYPDDTELLEDVIIENKQAIEMCAIYRDILSGTMDAFASVISNNLNIVMKLLTSITIVLTIPTLIGTLWGMNVNVPFQGTAWGFFVVLGIMAVAMGLGVYWMSRRKMF